MSVCGGLKHRKYIQDMSGVARKCVGELYDGGGRKSKSHSRVMGAHIPLDKVGLHKINLYISVLGLILWLAWEGEACPAYA